jgi:hypothetical protein
LAGNRAAVAAGSIVSGAIVACALLARRLEACQLASRLKNNLLPSAEIGFVSLWCFMQAIKLQRKPGHERTWRPQQIA